MKKILILLTFIFCAGSVFAQSGAQLVNKIKHSPVKTLKPKGEMRVFVKEGEEIITNFESAYLTAAPKIHIIMPSENKQERKPSIYIIDSQEIDRAKIQERLPNFFDKYFFVTVKLENDEADFAPFLTRELLPYVEVNYPISSKPKERTLIAKNTFAINYLANLPELFEYLQNAILGFDYTSALPKIEAPKGLNLWACGPLENMAALHVSLAKNNLVYLQDFAYNITKKDQLVEPANLEFLFNKEGRKIVKTNVYQPLVNLDLSKDFAAPLWLNLTTKGGYNLAYVPQSVRVSPPFLNWDNEQGIFTVIPGATVGKVKVDGKTEFGKKFKTKFNLINSQR